MELIPRQPGAIQDAAEARGKRGRDDYPEETVRPAPGQRSASQRVRFDWPEEIEEAETLLLDGFVGRIESVLSRFGSGELNESDTRMWLCPILGKAEVPESRLIAVANALVKHAPRSILMLAKDVTLKPGIATVKVIADPTVLVQVINRHVEPPIVDDQLANRLADALTTVDAGSSSAPAGSVSDPQALPILHGPSGGGKTMLALLAALRAG